MPGVLQSGFARLTRAEYRATIKDAFGVDADVSGIPEDGRVGPFTSNIAFAERSGAAVPARQRGSGGADRARPAARLRRGHREHLHLDELPAKPFERLFRRPVATTELGAWSTMLGDLEKAGLTAEGATRAMVTSALLHPDAMFRTTPLAGDAARARRLAEHLSYALWDAPPDAELAAVGAGTAADLGARLRSQAERLGRDPRAVPVLARFMAQWLHVDLDLKLGADTAYATSPLYLELLAFVQDALASGAPVTSFVNGTRGFVHKNNLAPVRPDLGAGDGGRGARDLAGDARRVAGSSAKRRSWIRRGIPTSAGARSSAACWCVRRCSARRSRRPAPSWWRWPAR